jgi:PAS domain S-box-containing protein
MMQSFSESANWMATSLSPDGLITAISATAEHLTGYSAEELVGRPASVILGDRHVFEISQMLKSAFDWGVWDGEIVHRHRSGRQLRARASLVLLSSTKDQCAGFLLLSDLREKPIEGAGGSALQDAAAHLRKVSHELNNPLAVMMGFTQLTLMDSHCDGKMRDDIERIYSETKRVIQIVEKLHSYAVSLQEMNAEPAPVRKTS